MTAYYNENDSFAAAWLRGLIKEGLIADGVVDERSICEVQPGDLRGFTQVHLFAGIGGWSYALRLAGVPDSVSVWSGSCPCQPFSVAGKRKGTADKRHLWPEMFRLVKACKPERIVGEQVQGAVKLGWLDGIFADLEGEGYTCGAEVLGAHSVGAPHIRQRLYWVADAEHAEWRPEHQIDGDAHGRDGFGRRSDVSGMGDADDARSQGRREHTGEHADQLTAWSASVFIPCADGKHRRVPANEAGEPESAVLAVVDGLPASMGAVRRESVEALEKEIVNYAAATKTGPREAVFDVWCSLVAEALQRDAGGQLGVSSPSILLSFLRQLARQGWAFSESVSRASAQTQEAVLRGLRMDEVPPCASCESGLDKQRSEQPANAMPQLSQILARATRQAWGDAFKANAQSRFPLAYEIKNRVCTLRGAGNAIVPQVAARFIKASGLI